MKTANMTRNKGQVYSVGNYLMTGKVLGKGHFARVEEATHRIIGKKVAIKIIDLTCIKEEYARRNLHREPRVMAKLRHPCIAALYETMMHGPRLYVVMEAAGGGDLCAHVLGARGAARGLPEGRARALAAQLVSAVRHMHARGVVHRDLKMENIMLDSTKQFIKIVGETFALTKLMYLNQLLNQINKIVSVLVDFGLSNMWSGGAALRTPCGSLEYAAPELFVDGRRYGPEVDLWSIGVIVYGMVTGGLPFTGAEGGESKSRPQLRAAISRGFTRKQRAALACVTPGPHYTLTTQPRRHLARLHAQAARRTRLRHARSALYTYYTAAPTSRAASRASSAPHSPASRPVRTIHLLHSRAASRAASRASSAPHSPASRPMVRTSLEVISDCSSLPECKAFIQHLLEPNVELRMKIEEASRHRWVRRPGMRMKTHPFGTIDPVVNREIYRQISELCTMPVIDVVAEIKSEPFGPLGGMYNIKCHLQQAAAAGTELLWGAAAPEPRPRTPPPYRAPDPRQPDPERATTSAAHHRPPTTSPPKIQVVTQKIRIPSTPPPRPVDPKYVNGNVEPQIKTTPKVSIPERAGKKSQLQSPRSASRPPASLYGVKKPVYRVYDSGDCGLDPRLPSIDEHSNSEVNDAKKLTRSKNVRMPCVRKVSLDEDRPLRHNSCPTRLGDKRAEFYRKAGDGLPSWRASGTMGTPPPRILLQNNATTIKRASLGSIVSPHSSSNSQCRSERAMPVGWYSRAPKDGPLQRLRRTAPMK
ncbi:hypothetical protein SFRURICE_009910 [Spodoptera frugiperda]|nr:hypothetical protein SFRURICE_009910 [Spodoptera frugiperda]